jgi:nicotinate phosphoribosyltransferase
MSVLDLDFYKLTMLQFIWKHYADLPVTFRLHSRKQDLGDIIHPRRLRRRIAEFREAAPVNAEIEFLRGTGYFEESFLNDLASLFLNREIPEPYISGPHDFIPNVEVSGDWFKVSLWETVILSAVSEQYSKENVPEPSNIRRYADIYAIEQSGARWADFGTRRRWSKRDHALLNIRLANEKARGNLDSFIGTSNVMMARKLDLKPIGTYAHELEMVLRPYCASEFATTRNVLAKWGAMYPRDLRVALTDTYTTKKFLQDHGDYLLENDWRGVRLDSGDPMFVGWDVTDWLERNGDASLDIVFSDSLDADTILRLQTEFGSEFYNVNPVFGWGTGLTNPNSDLSLVMKAVESRGVKTYKVTDDKSKSIRS